MRCDRCAASSLEAYACGTRPEWELNDMSGDFKVRLAKSAENDSVMRDALKEIEWFERRPFEEFPAYWHARLNEPRPGPSWRQLANQRAEAGDSLAKEALDQARALAKRIHAELEAIAWYNGWVDACPPGYGRPRGQHVDTAAEQMLVRIKEMYVLGGMQHAHFQGWHAGRRLCLMIEKSRELAAMDAMLERDQTDSSVQ